MTATAGSIWSSNRRRLVARLGSAHFSFIPTVRATRCVNVFDPLGVGGSDFVEAIEIFSLAIISRPTSAIVSTNRFWVRKNGTIRRRRGTSRGWAALLRRRNRRVEKDQFSLLLLPPIVLFDSSTMAHMSKSVSKAQWRPTRELATALQPSTSKDFVLPRCDRAFYAGYGFVTDGGHVRLDSVLLRQFYQLEQFSRPSSKCFECVQSEVTVQMRQILLQWMFEVSAEERCSNEVFPLGVLYLDRFLSVEAVHKQQLQALGAACLFLASKVKETLPFSSSRLVQYTDESVPISELLSWELLVLNRLNWDLASLTAFDFLDQFIPCSYVAGDVKWRMEMANRVAKLYMDFNWATRLPSEIAAQACIEMTEKTPIEIAHDIYVCALGKESDDLYMTTTNDSSDIEEICITSNARTEQSQIS